MAELELIEKQIISGNSSPELLKRYLRLQRELFLEEHRRMVRELKGE